ncbi:hypothetical protein GCM10008967_35350 [Bacillus carboniphilus]|uniref:Uncharacterized protein n=1 Tax=Bacillus carboniphilus TaxID=86663 RepID=A0ABN0WMG6_9BACI
MNATITYYTATILGAIGVLFFLRKGWKSYGLLFLTSSSVAIILCFVFVKLGFYSFPHIPFPVQSQIPFIAMTLTFPVGVMFGVRYSPKQWIWKVPFYWAIVHIGVGIEAMIKGYTSIIKYDYQWDLWDTYTWWWIYFLFLEWVGGKMIPDHLKRPIDGELFRYGRSGWIIFHLIVIITIFLAGYYLGKITN